MGSLVFGAKKILDQPVSRNNWYKKIAVWPFLILLGLPIYLLAFCFTLLPLLAGSAVLYYQVHGYLRDGRWYQFSILDATTQTVAPRLSENLGAPKLSSCVQPDTVLIDTGKGSDIDLIIAGYDVPKTSCLQSSAWMSWVVEPNSWFGLHNILIPPLRLFSVPLVLFGVSLFTWQFFSGWRNALVGRIGAAKK